MRVRCEWLGKRRGEGETEEGGILKVGLIGNKNMSIIEMGQ